MLENNIKINRSRFSLIPLLLFTISICIFWDNSYTKLGFVLCSTATVLVLFYDALKKFTGIASLITSGYFWWILIILLMIISTLGNVPPTNQLTQYIKVTLIFEIFIVYGLTLFTGNRWDRTLLVKVCIYSSLILCSWITIHELDSIMNISSETRIGWSAGGANPNYVGLLLGFFSTITLYEFLISKKKSYILILLIQYSFMLMTGSKKVLIFLIGSISLMLLFRGNRYKKIFNLALVILVFIVIYQLVMNVEFLYQIMGVRIERFLHALGITGYEEDYSTTHRLFYIKEAVRQWESNPLLGFGYQSFNYVLGYGTYTHNNYVEILVSFGVIGLILFYGVYLIVLFNLIRFRKKLKDAELFIILLILQLITDTGVVSYYDILVFYISIIGAWYLIKNKDRFKNG
jgi:O-antigen ligase